METINELVNEIYEDNYSHLELNDSMGGEACSCPIHTTLNTIVKYRDGKEGEVVKDYGFIVEGGGLICSKCADNPLYQGFLERVESVGYPQGYSCAECGDTVEGEGK